ncbi:MAG: hypothetical protein Q8N23_01430 [Archangium sp.]|nr:hypothetical protein [Archangium sp.]MDP3151299.1 hypothetical protein [Archangium sp.]MDP3571644.1 hypothetical protein [Archangium sp.]
MKALLLVMTLSAAAFAQTARPPANATTESSRLGAEYFVQRAGAAWTYQLGKGKGRVTIVSFVDWRAQVSIALGKVTGGATWRVKEGAWLERSGLRGEHEAILLPATMSRGTRWQDVASIERGGSRPSSFEVLALEAQVELPTGMIVEHCLAVLEMPEGGGDAYTHYYAPNIGKVAVQGPEGWVYRLVEFRSGARGHSE